MFLSNKCWYFSRWTTLPPYWVYIIDEKSEKIIGSVFPFNKKKITKSGVHCRHTVLVKIIRPLQAWYFFSNLCLVYIVTFSWICWTIWSQIYSFRIWWDKFIISYIYQNRTISKTTIWSLLAKIIRPVEVLQRFSITVSFTCRSNITRIKRNLFWYHLTYTQHLWSDIFSWVKVRVLDNGRGFANVYWKHIRFIKYTTGIYAR